MKRICKECKIEKHITSFVNGHKKGIYRYKCKDCANLKRRKINPDLSTRFKKGHEKGKRYQKNNLPWNTGKTGLYELPRKSRSRYSAKTKEWILQVKARDGFKCAKCGIEENIHAHHIKPWKDHPELRFDVNNGTSLCNSCHGKEEGFKKGQTPWNKDIKGIMKAWNRGISCSKKTRMKISESKKDSIPWNKGKKLTMEHIKKLCKPKRRLKNVNSS